MEYSVDYYIAMGYEDSDIEDIIIDDYMTRLRELDEEYAEYDDEDDYE